MRKKNYLRRSLSGLLAAIICLSCVPGTVLAEEEDVPTAYSTLSAETKGGSATLLPYQNPALSDEERAVDLVSRMTSEEKFWQLLTNNAVAIPRLGVKEYLWWSEALHGVARDGTATSFPTGLGIAATWDTDLVYQMISATSDEAREKYNSQTNAHGLAYFSPTINMSRDPRWGRVEETYGEDPYLTSLIADAYVRGLQGDIAATGYVKAIATPKHFLGNNSEQNRHTGSSDITERDLREYYMRAFQYAVEESGALSIMTAYNAVNGVPMSTNQPILEDIVRRTWGFEGFVVTDCGALRDVLSKHSWRPETWGDKEWTGAAVAAYALMSGTDLNCGDVLALYSQSAITEGLIGEGLVDRALVRLFTARISTGEFDADGGYYGGDQFVGEVHAQDHQQLAETSSDNAVVLLKNEGNILPLTNSVTNLVLIGDRADEVILGDYSTNEPMYTSTPVAGIEAALKRANPSATFTYLQPTVEESAGLMNVRGPKLLDANGGVVDQFDLKTNSGMSGCRIENETTENPNMAYTTDGCWFKFEAGSVSFENVTKFSVEIGGIWSCTPTRVEIRATDPRSGPLLGTVDMDHHTNDWQNYETLTFDAMLGGGYADQPLYIVLSAIPQPIELTQQDKDVITAADVVIYYAGTKPGEGGFSEESDGSSLDLPNDQDSYISAIAALNPNTVVYMQTVSHANIESFKDSVKAILWSTYNGQAQGNAAGRILFGEVNPSAKLPFTWYTNVDDLAEITDYALQASGSNPGRTYQYFNGDITYPFGYGLSYTTFAYHDLVIDKNMVTPDDVIKVSFDVTNTGTVAGQEVAQLYVVTPDAAANARPVKQLKAFDKKLIQPGETVHYELELAVEDLWFWDDVNDVQTYDQGVYTIQVGADSAACEAMTETFTLTGQLTKVLERTTVISDGHVLNMAHPEKTITAEASAVFNDQSFVDLGQAQVQYISGDENVVTVDANGVVRPVNTGLTTVTVSVTVDGVTKSDSFAVKVNQGVFADGISVGGEPLTGFRSDVTDYAVCIADLDSIPTVTVSKRSDFQAAVTQATKTSPAATVTVSSQGMSITYTIHFTEAPKSIDFTTATAGQFNDIFTVENEDAAMWSLDENGLNVTTQNGDLYGGNTSYKNLFIQSGGGDWTAETRVVLEKEPFEIFQQAGLLVLDDADNYIKLGYEFGGSGCNVQFGHEENGIFYNMYNSGTNVTELYYRLTKAGDVYTGYYSLDGIQWTQVGTLEKKMSEPKLGLLASNGTGGNSPLGVTYKYLNIDLKCTCELYDLVTDSGENCALGLLPVTHTMNASVKVRGNCPVTEHNTDPVITYALLNGEGASVNGSELTMTGDGQATVRVTAKLGDAAISKDVVYTASWLSTTPEDYGWITDETGGSRNYSGWTAFDATSISAQHSQTVSNRIWRSMIPDGNNFTVTLDYTVNNVSSGYIKILGQILELNGSGGNGNQAYIKYAGGTFDWLDGQDGQFHIEISRANGGQIQVTIIGKGNENNPMHLSASMAENSGDVELGIYGGSVSWSDVRCTSNSYYTVNWILDGSTIRQTYEAGMSLYSTAKRKRMQTQRISTPSMAGISPLLRLPPM